MWSAQFVSNIGSWMQTVAAQWLMLTLTGSAAYVALVQTAAGLPVVLFAIVAGRSATWWTGALLSTQRSASPMRATLAGCSRSSSSLPGTTTCASTSA